MTSLPRTALTAAVLSLNDNEDAAVVTPTQTSAATTQTADPPAAMTFDDRMKAVFDSMQSDLATPPASPPLPTPSSTPAPQITTTPQSDAAPAATAGGGASASPPAVASPAPAVPPPAAPQMQQPNELAQAFSAIAQMQQQQAQINAALYQRLQPPAPATTTTLSDVPPTLEQSIADYRQPQQRQGETNAAYDARIQADIYDHAQSKQREWFVAKSKQIAKEAADGVRAELAQQQQARTAAQNYVNLVGGVVNEAGYKGNTPVAQAAFNYADRTLTALHARGITDGWGEQQWRAAATHFVREFSSAVPPPPVAGTPPALALVPNAPAGTSAPAAAPAGGPPIASGTTGAGGGVPAAPPSKTTPKPKNFDEAMEQVWQAAQKTG